MEELQHFGIGFIRLPLYSFKKFLSIPNQKGQLYIFIKQLWEDKVFKEAIFLASYELYNEWEKLINDFDSFSAKQKRKIEFSILKYYIRISTRSTPFGLFSSHSMFELDKSFAELNKQNCYDNIKRFTTIDLHFLFKIINRINNIPEFINQHNHYIINNSIYRLGDSYRYVETRLENDKKSHILSSIEANEVMELFCDQIKKPFGFRQIVQLLIDNVEGVSLEEATQYIHGLIDAQFFISTFDICLNEPSPLNQILNDLNNDANYPDEIKKIKFVLEKIKKELIVFNCLGNNIDLYKNIYRLADSLSIPYNKKFLINTNLGNEINCSPLNREDIFEIKKVIKLISFFSSKEKKNRLAQNLDSFKQAFYERYEEQEVPLLVALDNEAGIGYIQEQSWENDFSPLIDDLKWPDQNDLVRQVDFNTKIHALWNKYIYECLSQNKEFIDLKNKDLSEFDSTLNKQPNTLSAIVKKMSGKLYITPVSNSSCLNLIARFSNEDDSFLDKMEKIIEKEQEDEDIVYAELLHLPDYRTGNILLRQIKRGYEVPYLTKSSKTSETLNLNDILVSIRSNKVILRSKKLGKRIRILQTTAHNFNYNSLPVYQFLCDLQTQEVNNLSLNIGEVNFISFDHIPRIVYGNKTILSPARWSVHQKNIKKFDDENDKKFLKQMREHLKLKGVPRYIYFGQSDNQLLIDIEKDVLLALFAESLKKRKKLIITECLYNPNSDYSSNEMIIPFYNGNHAKNTSVLREKPKNIQELKRKYIPGDTWLYYKIYCGVKSADKILKQVVLPISRILQEKKLIKKWFFIRYYDTDSHIRLRFEIREDKDNCLQRTISLFNLNISKYVESHIIWKIELGTYAQEIERYEGKFITSAETIFYLDSELVLELLTNVNNYNELWLYTLKSIDSYFNLFNLSLEQKLRVAKGLYDGFQMEFEVGANIRKQIDVKFRENKSVLSELLSSNVGEYSQNTQIIDNYINNMKKNCIEINELTLKQRTGLVESFIHMHINRLIRSRQRIHELVIYGIAEKYYKMVIGRKKYLEKK